MNDMVLQKLEGGLLTITMNRPDRRNALSPDMTRGLVEAARRAAEDYDVRAVLLKGAGGTYFLTQLLGSAKARELYLTSPVLTAKEAYDLGMVTRVVPDAEVEAAAHELAMSLAQGPSVTLGYIKRNINNAEHLSLEACFDGEAIHHTRAGETADHKEAAKAFVEKRKANFQGK